MTRCAKNILKHVKHVTGYAHLCLPPPTASWTVALLYSSLFFSGA